MFASEDTMQNKSIAMLSRFMTCCALIFYVVAAPAAWAKDFKFAWTGNPEPVEGYKLYYKKGGNAGPPFDGTGSFQGASPVSIGKQTTFTVRGLEDNSTYHFALTAYNSSGESGFSAIITVPSTEPAPTALISSSTTVGNTPLAVRFDGSGSVAINATISSYSWDFGDGTSAEGAIASHTYRIAGSYYASLTVIDSAGRTGITSIPISIVSTQLPANQTPIASFTASQGSGATPLTVTFDGSGSTDQDGTIANYRWNFGDGFLASGISPQHTFTDIKDYKVILSVTDNRGATATMTKTISVRSPEDAQPYGNFIAIIPALNLLLLGE